jgi:hypothetical protein
VYKKKDTIVYDEQLQRFIDNQWHTQVRKYEKEGMKMFNGKLFRLKHFHKGGDRVFLELGDTNYKDYVGTSIKEFYESHPYDKLANPLAVSVTLVTSDRKILVEKRNKMDVYRGRYHVIGGFIERDIDVGADSRPDPFKAIKREVWEEIGVALLDENLFSLGLVRNLKVPHPEVCFFARMDISSEEVFAISAANKLDGEIEQLDFIEDSSDDLARFIVFNHGNIVATGEACMLLYGNDRYGEAWYNDTLQSLKEG